MSLGVGAAYRFGGGLIYLFECQRLGPLLGHSRLPHTDGRAGAASNNQLRVRTYGTEDLTPL